MMANYGRGWDDGYGHQSAEAIDAHQEREARTALACEHRHTIPHGAMMVATARRKWRELYEAAQDGTDPARTFDAVQEFNSIAEAMFIEWREGDGDKE